MTIKVYDINEEVHKEQLVSEDITNIHKIFDKIFSSNNTDHQKVECFTNDNSLLKVYQECEDFDLETFADELLKAEKKKIIHGINKLLKGSYL